MGQRHQIYHKVEKGTGTVGIKKDFIGIHDQWLYGCFAIKMLKQYLEFQKNANKYSILSSNSKSLNYDKSTFEKFKRIYSLRISDGVYKRLGKLDDSQYIYEDGSNTFEDVAGTEFYGDNNDGITILNNNTGDEEPLLSEYCFMFHYCELEGKDKNENFSYKSFTAREYRYQYLLNDYLDYEADILEDSYDKLKKDENRLLEYKKRLNNNIQGLKEELIEYNESGDLDYIEKNSKFITSSKLYNYIPDYKNSALEKETSKRTVKDYQKDFLKLEEKKFIKIYNKILKNKNTDEKLLKEIKDLYKELIKNFENILFTPNELKKIAKLKQEKLELELKKQEEQKELESNINNNIDIL